MAKKLNHIKLFEQFNPGAASLNPEYISVKGDVAICGNFEGENFIGVFARGEAKRIIKEIKNSETFAAFDENQVAQVKAINLPVGTAFIEVDNESGEPNGAIYTPLDAYFDASGIDIWVSIDGKDNNTGSHTSGKDADFSRQVFVLVKDKFIASNGGAPEFGTLTDLAGLIG